MKTLIDSSFCSLHGLVVRTSYSIIFKSSVHARPCSPGSRRKPFSNWRNSRQAQLFRKANTANVYQQRLSIAVNALAAAGDVSIAAVLCTLLHKSRTGFQRWWSSFDLLIHTHLEPGPIPWSTSSLVNPVWRSYYQTYIRQILFSVNTGLLTRSVFSWNRTYVIWLTWFS